MTAHPSITFQILGLGDRAFQIADHTGLTELRSKAQSQRYFDP